MYSGIVTKIGFFHDKDDTFLGRIVPLLQPFLVKQKEFVYKKGDYPTAGRVLK